MAPVGEITSKLKGAVPIISFRRSVLLSFLSLPFELGFFKLYEDIEIVSDSAIPS